MDEDLVVWDDSLSVEFAPIDNQHKELVAMINEHIKSCKAGGGEADSAFMQTFEKTVAYARTHFSDEEKHLRDAFFPNIDAHKEMHFQFLFELVNIVNEVESGKSTPLNMVTFLKTWLMNHIAVTDKQYVPYLKKKNDRPRLI